MEISGQRCEVGAPPGVGELGPGPAPLIEG